MLGDPPFVRKQLAISVAHRRNTIGLCRNTLHRHQHRSVRSFELSWENAEQVPGMRVLERRTFSIQHLARATFSTYGLVQCFLSCKQAWRDVSAERDSRFLRRSAAKRLRRSAALRISERLVKPNAKTLPVRGGRQTESPYRGAGATRYGTAPPIMSPAMPSTAGHSPARARQIPPRPTSCCVETP